jgi:hypothetical protein
MAWSGGSQSARTFSQAMARFARPFSGCLTASNIIRCVFVSLRTMCFHAVMRYRPYPAHHVLTVRDWFKVIRIDTGGSATQVIKFQPFGDLSAMALVDPSMRHIQFPVLPHLSVAKMIGGTLPYPAAGSRIYDVFQRRFAALMTGNVTKWHATLLLRPLIRVLCNTGMFTASTLAQSGGDGRIGTHQNVLSGVVLRAVSAVPERFICLQYTACAVRMV